MDWESKRVLVTGASHFISAHLVGKLVRSGSNVRAFAFYDYHDNFGSLDRLPLYIRSRVEVIKGSLTNTEAIDSALEGADVVFHFGMLDMVQSDIGIRDYLENTVIGTFNVLNSAKKHNVQKLVHISTAEVYGKVDDVPVDESHPIIAGSPYISGDIAAEKLVEGYFLSYNLPATVVRLFNTYGPMQSKNAIIPTIIIQGLSELEVFLGDMHTVRDFVYVEDVVDGLIKAAESDESAGEIINLGSGQGISVGDLADKIVSLIGRDVEIIFDATRIRPQSHNVDHLVASVKKASELIGWSPQVSLDAGLGQTIRWFSEHSETKIGWVHGFGS